MGLWVAVQEQPWRPRTADANAQADITVPEVSRVEAVELHAADYPPRTTSATPSAVTPMPASTCADSASPNSSQAITAVVGGTR